MLPLEAPAEAPRPRRRVTRCPKAQLARAKALLLAMRPAAPSSPRAASASRPMSIGGVHPMRTPCLLETSIADELRRYYFPGMPRWVPPQTPALSHARQDPHKAKGALDAPHGSASAAGADGQHDSRLKELHAQLKDSPLASNRAYFQALRTYSKGGLFTPWSPMTQLVPRPASSPGRMSPSRKQEGGSDRA